MNLNLKAEVVRKFQTQANFARTLGIRESLVSGVVRGRQNLTDDEKKQWAKALGFSPAKLFGGGNE
jgi:plasmid maintenance system antidote protein VapI